MTQFLAPLPDSCKQMRCTEPPFALRTCALEFWIFHESGLGGRRSFKSAGHQAVGWINFFVAPLGQLGLVLQALDPHAPLLIDGLAARLQFLHRPKSNLDLFWTEDFQNAVTDGFVNQVSLDPHALRGIVGVCLATGAFVNGINPSMTGVARRQSASAMPTEKQPLQERAALACSATGTLFRLIGLV